MICGFILLLLGGVLGRVIVDEKYGTGSDTGGNWNYKCHNEDPNLLGPYDWKKEYPECKGYSQSPILLPTVFADMSFLDRLEYEGCWDNQFAWDLENDDGRAVMLKVPDDVKMRPSVTTIAGKFLLNAIVFRYGKESCMGSEHGMNGRMYPAEVQKFFVSSEYNSFWEAAKVPGKIAIVSHILETSEEDNQGFDGLLDNLHNINGTDKPYKLDWYAKVLFQEEGKKCSNCDYFFYEGSLSFPPCNEVALWFVMMKTIQISERQLNVLRSVLSSTTQEPMVCNNRVPQPANFRDILQHRELDFKSYDNYQPALPPMMPPPGAYPPGVRPPPPGAYPPMMPPAYRQDPSGNSAGGQDAYPPQPYRHQPYPSHPSPYPNPYPYPTQSTPSPDYPDQYTNESPPYHSNPYRDQYTTESPPSYPSNPYQDPYTTESPPSYPSNPYQDPPYITESPPSYPSNPYQDPYTTESPPSYPSNPYEDQFPSHNRYPYPPSHYPVPTTASPHTTEEPNYPPHYNQPTPPERYYRHPTPPRYQPTPSPYHTTTTTTTTTTTSTTTTTTEKPYHYPTTEVPYQYPTTEVPYQYPTTETPYPEYNPRTDTHEHQQYPRFDPHHRARG